MSSAISKRVEKLEAIIAPERVLLCIGPTHEGDPDEVIERLKAEAIEAWLADNPGRAVPPIHWLISVIVNPPPTALTYGIH